MKGFMTAKEASEKWGVSVRQVQIYCKNGRVPGALKMGTSWVMPDNLLKPSIEFVCKTERTPTTED